MTSLSLLVGAQPEICESKVMFNYLIFRYRIYI